MILRIAHPEDIFSYLSRISESMLDLDESDADPQSCTVKTLVSDNARTLHSPLSDLPGPMEGVGLRFYVFGDSYGATVAFLGENLQAFNGISERLGRRFENLAYGHEEKKKPLIWRPYSSRGIGTLLDDRTPILKVVTLSTKDSSNEGNGRIISLGCFGAEPRSLSKGFEEFDIHTRLLQEAASLYLDAFYSMHPEGRDKIKDEEGLYLDCTLV